VSRIPTPSKAQLCEDVTAEYLSTAVPGYGSVTYDKGYRVKDHQHEIDMAEWLHRTFGGNIVLLKESEIKNQKMADLLWNNKLWELKSASSINGADKLMQHAIKQIQDNPGGVILNVVEELNLSQLEYQLMRRIRRSQIGTFDLILLSKSGLVRILRYRK